MEFDLSAYNSSDAVINKQNPSTKKNQFLGKFQRERGYRSDEAALRRLIRAEIASAVAQSTKSSGIPNALRYLQKKCSEGEREKIGGREREREETSRC